MDLAQRIQIANDWGCVKDLKGAVKGNNFDLERAVKSHFIKNGPTLDRIYEQFTNNEISEEKFWNYVSTFSVKLNNLINYNLSDTFKADYNIWYDTPFGVCNDTRWCTYDKIFGIFLKIICGSKYNKDRGVYFSRYTYSAMRNFTGNIINKTKCEVNKKMKKFISLNVQQNVDVIDALLNNQGDIVNPIMFNDEVKCFIMTHLNDNESKLIMLLMTESYTDAQLIKYGKFGSKATYFRLKKSIRNKWEEYKNK